MPEPDDITLLKQYTGGDESAFTLLFERHVNLVYSTAIRQVRDPSHAEEITQAVFILLARKAKSLSPKTVLSGWLYQAARLTTANLIKREARRQRREQELYMQTLTEPEISLWEQISPLLDEAMGRLGEQDRNAIVLRFFENRTPQEVAATLKLNEVTARKRVSRALEKLRNFFTKRGVVLTTAIIAGAISGNSVQAAPAAIAHSVTAVAITKGAAASASTLTLVKGALKIMAWKKVMTAAAVGIGVLLAGSIATTVIVKEIAHHRDEALWAGITRIVNSRKWDQIENIPPTVSIRPSAFPNQNDDFANDGKGTMLGLAVPGSGVFADAYAVNRTRIANPQMLPSGRYDFIITIRDPSEKALQEVIKERFGLIAKIEPQNMDVLVLKVANPALPGLKPFKPNSHRRGVWTQNGHATFYDEPVSMLASELEDTLGTPVIDQTGLTGHYNIDLAWNTDPPSPDEVKQTVLNQLGLSLVPSHQTLQVLVLEKAK